MAEKLVKVQDLTGKFPREVEFRGFPKFKSTNGEGEFLVPQRLVDMKLSKHPFAWGVPGNEVKDEEPVVELSNLEKLDKYSKVSNLEQLQEIFEQKYGATKNDIINGNPGHKKSYLEPLKKLVEEEDETAIQIVDELFATLN